MKQFVTVAILLTALVLLALAPSLSARDNRSNKSEPQVAALADPAYCIAAHRIGKISLSVNNNGNLGSGWPAGGSAIDCFTGVPVPSCEYPIGSNIEYLFAGALWIGAVVGTDTLVSTSADGWSSDGAEFRPDVSPYGEMIYRSTLLGDPDAVSEEDYIAVYYDTFPYVDPNAYDGELHHPLNIRVVQSSYAWSCPHAEDFVLIEYAVSNLGQEPLNEMQIGLYVDGDVGHIANPMFWSDDVTGFLKDYDVSAPGGVCNYRDTSNLAWIADNSGDAGGSPDFDATSCVDVTGISLVRLPMDQPAVSYNWWMSNATADLDFGPRERSGVGVWPEDFRDFGTGGLGTPEGDHNKYYQLRNLETDYDQAFTAVIPENDPLWMYPDPSLSQDLADGFDTRYLLSFGLPRALEPGETFPFTVAFVAGENLHTRTDNIVNLPNNPDEYYDNLDFSDLAFNARMAEWVYDNPGVDTDQDGYFGEAIECNGERVYIHGDGVPDYRVATPPSAPRVWGEWLPGDDEAGLVIRWNGFAPETGIDSVTQEHDFEGYNVYMSTDGTSGSYVVKESFDIVDFVVYTWYEHEVPVPGWFPSDRPYTLEELRCTYGSSCDDLSFDPLAYTVDNPLPYLGEYLIYFVPHGDNSSLEIAKTYPDQPYPSSLDPSEVDPSELTEDGYFKYFEYEYRVLGLKPQDGTCYWVSVTAFDFGFPSTGALPLESACEQVGLEVCPYGAPYGPAQQQNGYMLHQNKPNPFNPETGICFSLPTASQVKLEVYNIAGQKIATLADGMFQAGEHTIHWNASSLASGVYLYKLEAGRFVETKKMILLK